MDVNLAWNQFHNTFLSVLSNHIPNKFLTTRKSLPLITYHLQLLLRKQDQAYKKAKRTVSPTDWATYRRLRNKGVSMLCSAKRNFLKNLSTNLRSPKQFWSAYHSLSTNYQRIPRLLTNGSHTVESPFAKANMLNSYSHQPAQTYHQPLPPPLLFPHYLIYPAPMLRCTNFWNPWR